LLRDVRENPGEFFERVDEDGHHGVEGVEAQEEEPVDPEWEAAVREGSLRLGGLRGVASVTRGFSDADEPIVLVLTAQGLTKQTFENLIPAEIRGFPVLTAIPFDALPLRREGGFGSLT
jgi:hypothetical protein